MNGVTVGRTVHYTLSHEDADAINRRRTSGASIAERIKAAIWPMGVQAHIGNAVAAGDVVPLIVVKVDPIYGEINGQAILDGTDVLWLMSISFSHEPYPGRWNWPPRAGDPR